MRQIILNGTNITKANVFIRKPTPCLVTFFPLSLKKYSEVHC